jgi:hypothetical protein
MSGEQAPGKPAAEREHADPRCSVAVAPAGPEVSSGERKCHEDKSDCE